MPHAVGEVKRKEKASRPRPEVQPRYARDFLWEEDRHPTFLTSADLSERAPPMPLPPSRSCFTPDFLHTLDSHPTLFKVVTPVNVDKLEYLLCDHPNRPFVKSVLRMMREGAWPWAKPPPTTFSPYNDQSQDLASLERYPDRLAFYEKECQKEYDAGRYSDAFPSLLPGMACMPTYVIERRGKMQLITDQTCVHDLTMGLNSLVDKEDRAVPLCNLQQFGYTLRDMKATSNGRDIVIFKCDVKGAYRLIPMHPLWQMLQAARLPDGSFVINRNNTFGGGASGRCWWCLMSLILWVARAHFHCDNLFDYVDDVFSAAFVDSLTLYPRYDQLMPAPQVRFLSCLDTLDVPHDLAKQLWDYTLTVTGLLIDGNALVITMPDSSRTELLHALEDFITFSSRTSRRCRTLRECQALAGHVNWALNVYPRLRPGLASLYGKMGGPYRPQASIHINTAVVRDLTWLLDRIRTSTGVFLLTSIAWRSREADVTIYTDACLEGLGFWCLQLNRGYHCGIVCSDHDLPIFFHEASVVVCALHWFCQLHLSDISLVTAHDTGRRDAGMTLLTGSSRAVILAALA